MKKQTLFAAFIALAALLPFLVGCNNDTPEPLKKTEITNAALATVLKNKGYTLEGNMLVMDEKAQNTTVLDLSSCGLTDVSGLEIFPKLEEVNLANNGLGPAFDFAPLPTTIKRVNLSDNEIYDYLNLAETDYEQGEYTLIRELDKLTLPAVAKYNMDNLPAFMKTAPQCDMQMQNQEGKPEKYTTLREIPDPVMLAFLKETFPSKFDGDKLDILKRFRLDETQTQIKIMRDGGWFHDPKFDELKNIEGLEYIINDSQFAGTTMLYFNKNEEKNLPYLKLGKKIQTLLLAYVNTPILDGSIAEELSRFAAYHNKDLKLLDISGSKKIFQKGEIGTDFFAGDLFALFDCPQLTDVKMPDLSKTPSPVTAMFIDLLELPLLKSIDISEVEVLNRLYLGGLPICKVKYPNNLLYFTDSGGAKIEDGKLKFSISKDVFDKPETKAFIEKYKKENRLATSESDFGIFPGINITPYNYLSSSKQNNSVKNSEKKQPISLIETFLKTTQKELK